MLRCPSVGNRVQLYHSGVSFQKSSLYVRLPLRPVMALYDLYLSLDRFRFDSASLFQYHT